MIDDLLPIGLLIVVAILLECLPDRIGLSSIVACTAAGTVLGPIAGIVEPTSQLQLFPGIGVLILLFPIGLDETDIPGFVATVRGVFFVQPSHDVAPLNAGDTGPGQGVTRYPGRHDQVTTSSTSSS